MSHSPADLERAWDFGMVAQDWIAFPVCESVNEMDWTSGKLAQRTSYWREQSWVDWRTSGRINYFTVEAFRSRVHARSRTKGVTEGFENFISWDATFSSRTGPVLAVDKTARKIKIGLEDGRRPYTWRVKEGSEILVSEGDVVKEKQVIAAAVIPIRREDLVCPGVLPQGHVTRLIASRERTQRFAGVKLARLLGGKGHEAHALELAGDAEEDVYVRLEALSYLVACCGHGAEASLRPYLERGDPQTQLEAVIALGETRTEEAVDLLARILRTGSRPYFLRSAAAWSLGQVGSEHACAELVSAFSSVDHNLRHEALDNLVSVGCDACNVLLEGLKHTDEAVIAGCAEALRQQPELPPEVTEGLLGDIRSKAPNKWIVWLVGHLPREQFNTAISELQAERPELHYAIALIWSFVESWIAKHWDLRPSAESPRG